MEHKSEIKVKRKLYWSIINEFTNENGEIKIIDKNEMIAFISNKMQHKNIKTHEVNNILSCFFDVEITRSRFGNSKYLLTPIFDKKGTEIVQNRECSFLIKKDTNLLKIINLWCK